MLSSVGHALTAQQWLQVGAHNEKRESFGHSVVYGPWGDLLGELNGEAPGLMTVELDFDELHRVRQRMPVAAHRAQGAAVVAGSIMHFDADGNAQESAAAGHEPS